MKNRIYSYMSANSLTSEHNYFEIRLTAVGSEKRVCLGLHHKYGSPSKLLGTQPGSIGWNLADGRYVRQSISIHKPTK